MAEQPQGCARVTGSVAGDAPATPKSDGQSPEKKEQKMSARVGQKAPDFTAPAYYRGGLPASNSQISPGNGFCLFLSG
jgi:hypothetical protein